MALPIRKRTIREGGCSQTCPQAGVENILHGGDAEEDCLYGAVEAEDASEQMTFSSEEFEGRKAADLKGFESFLDPRGVGDSSTFDPWRSLHFIVGQQIASISTIHTLVGSVSGRYLVPRILQYYSENPAVRTDIQRELFYGLSRWWWTYGKRLRPWPRAREPGPLDMGPWIAIIGMRLPTYPRNILADGSQDVTCLNNLLLLLHHRQSASTTGTLKDLGRREGIFWADKLTVGQVLSACYSQKILNRPERGDWGGYQQHLQILIRTLELINLWYPVQTYSPFSHVQVVEKILGIKLSNSGSLPGLKSTTRYTLRRRMTAFDAET
ncbi:hypothetical protein IFR05_013053 [Cadophora sp. M221]|nr:hypothetical protein IFR05_013053 [Cadophora sp. M221]